MNRTPSRKPPWLKVRFPGGPNYARIARYHKEQGLNSVCRSAACPNQGECWSQGTATFMILGDHCTRNCRFCNVSHAEPRTVNREEPDRIARAIADLGLKHAVITSVTRDDLQDGGASQFVAVTEAIRSAAPECRIELLIPDLQGDVQALSTILAARPDLLGHNLETVPRLYPTARQGADYRRSLDLLAASHRRAPAIPTKSGLMLGLGETDDELRQTMLDLLQVECRRLTLGQYLAPTREHLPVVAYIHPDRFKSWAEEGKKLGFTHVEAGPLVRSSYHAADQYQEANHVDL